MMENITKTLFMALTITMFVGCNSQSSTEQSGVATVPTSLAERAGRVAYSGAPPVIAHERQSGKCITCHNATGGKFPGVGSGFAPANPHLKTAGMSEQSKCTQCHLFKKSSELFVESDFQGFSRPTTGQRAYSKAPPVTPHHLFMRESCAACHTGEASRPEIRCSHANRMRCVQCHVQPGQAGTPQLADKK